MKNIIIRTTNSNMFTIVLGPFELMTQKHDNLNVCVGLGKSKDYAVYDIDETVINIGTQVAASLPFFHALTGADTTSACQRKAKLIE